MDPTEADLTESIENAIVPDKVALIQGESVIIGELKRGEQYFAWFLSKPLGTSWQTASSTGTITVPVPTSLSKAHRIAVANAVGVIIGWANVTISAAPVPAATPAAEAAATAVAAKKALAGTGTDPLPFALLAGLVIALGAAALSIGRRRGRAGLARPRGTR